MALPALLGLGRGMLMLSRFLLGRRAVGLGVLGGGGFFAFKKIQETFSNFLGQGDDLEKDTSTIDPISQIVTDSEAPQFERIRAVDLFRDVSVDKVDIVPELGPEGDRYEKHLNLIIERVASLESEVATQNSLINKLRGGTEEVFDQNRKTELAEKRRRSEDNVEQGYVRRKLGSVVDSVKSGVSDVIGAAKTMGKAAAAIAGMFMLSSMLAKAAESEDDDTIDIIIRRKLNTLMGGDEEEFNQLLADQEQRRADFRERTQIRRAEREERRAERKEQRAEREAERNAQAWARLQRRGLTPRAGDFSSSTVPGTRPRRAEDPDDLGVLIEQPNLGAPINDVSSSNEDTGLSIQTTGVFQTLRSLQKFDPVTMSYQAAVAASTDVQKSWFAEEEFPLPLETPMAAVSNEMTVRQEFINSMSNEMTVRQELINSIIDVNDSTLRQYDPNIYQEYRQISQNFNKNEAIQFFAEEILDAGAAIFDESKIANLVDNTQRSAAAIAINQQLSTPSPRVIVAPVMQPTPRVTSHGIPNMGDGASSPLESALPTYNTSDSFLDLGIVT